MRLAHRANSATLHQLDHPPVIVGGMNLSAHLGGHLRLGVGLAHHARLINTVGQRFLAVDVLARAHCRHAGQCVTVVGGADGDCLNGLVIDHLAPIGVRLGLGIFLVDFLQGLGVYITKSHDVFRGNSTQIG